MGAVPEEFSHWNPVNEIENNNGTVKTMTKIEQKCITVVQSTKENRYIYGHIYPERNFIGRLVELNRLKYAFLEPPHTTVVAGLGGIGKSQLARKFVEQNQSDYTNVIWITSEERESIENDFKIMSNELNILTNSEVDSLTILRKVFTLLSESQTLIVFDNVDKKETGDFVSDFVLSLRMLRIKPHVLIASRIQEWSQPIKLIKLEGFNAEDAVEYISRTLVDNENFYKDSREDMKQLAMKLQYFPLALRQATSHISHQRVEDTLHIADYIKEFDFYKKQILNSKCLLKNDLNKYSETTFTTWRVTVAVMAKRGTTGNLAIRLLRIISFFDCAHIRRDIFFNLTFRYSEDKVDIYEVKSAARLLVNYSMIDSQEDQRVFSVHRLVQQVTRIELENISGMTKTILRDGLQLISDIKSHKYYNITHKHGISVFTSALKFSELVKEYKDFPLNILKHLIEIRCFQRAKIFGGAILHTFAIIFGEENIDTLTTKSNVAYFYRELGEHNEALQMFQEVLEKMKKVLGEDHPTTLFIKATVATSYRKLRRHKEALVMNQEVFEKRKQILGENHPEISNIKNQVAISYRDVDKHTEALQMFDEVLKERTQILGDDHIDTLKTKSNVAFSYIALGKHTEAFQMYQEVFEKQKLILGDYDPDTIKNQMNVGYSYFQLGKVADALQIYEDIFEKRRTILGEDHPDTLSSKDDVAYFVHELGNHTEALQIDLVVYGKRKQILGEDHPDTLKSMYNVALAYHELDNDTEALQMYGELFKKRGQILGEDHLDTLTSKDDVAYMYSKLGKYTEALQMYQEVYEKRKQILGEDHEETLNTKSNIARQYRKLRKHDEALQMYQEVYEKQKQILGEDHTETLNTESNIARQYRKLGKRKTKAEGAFNVPRSF